MTPARIVGSAPVLLVRDVVASADYFRDRLGMKPYGVLEFGVQDLDDHDIAFGQIVGA